MNKIGTRSISFLDQISYNRTKLEFLGHFHKSEYAKDFREIVSQFTQQGVMVRDAWPVERDPSFTVDLKLEETVNLSPSLRLLQKQLRYNRILLEFQEIPWFPRSEKELEIIDATPPLVQSLRKSSALSQTWQQQFNGLEAFQSELSCVEYLQGKERLEYSSASVPRTRKINSKLFTYTGFRVKKVPTLLEPRTFFSHLAFRIYPLQSTSTEYLKGLLGIVPLLTNPEFAELCEAFGLASLGASESQIRQLQACYWYGVDFGVVRPAGQPEKVSGASIHNSTSMMKAAQRGAAAINKFDPLQIAQHTYKGTIFHHMKNFAEAKEGIRQLERGLNKKLSATVEKGRILAYRIVRLTKY